MNGGYVCGFKTTPLSENLLNVSDFLFYKRLRDFESWRKAVDRAGNVIESSTPLLITAGWTKPVEGADASSFWSFFSLRNLFVVSLLALAISLLAFIFYERKQFGKKEARLRKETKEIQDQMEKIFSALRDEIYDQINAITKKPRLSRKEKEAVNSLSSALEVSETLIEKEITDVQKILR